MENDTVFAEDANLGEAKAVNSQIFELGSKQPVNLSSDGSKCSDEDEVFEEAIDAESSAVDLEDTTLTKAGNDKLDSALDNENGNSDNFNDAEIEEFIETSRSDLDREVAVTQTELLKSEDGRHEEQISSDNFAGLERNGLRDSGIADHREGGNGGEVSDSAATYGETEKLINGKEVLVESNRKPDHVASSKLSYLAALASGDPQIEHEDNREQSLQLHDHQEPTQSTGVETGPKKHEIERVEMARSQDANTVEGGDTHSVILESCTVVHASLSDSLNYEDSTSSDSGSLKEHAREVQPEVALVGAVKGSEYSPSPESKSIGDSLHKYEQHDMMDSGLQRGKWENTLSKLHSDIQEVQGIELENNSVISDAAIKDDRIEGLKKLDSECVQIGKGDCHDVNTEGNGGVAAADTTGDNVKGTLELDTTNSPPAHVDCSLHANTADFNTHSSPTELLRQSSSSSEPRLLSETSPCVSTGKDEAREQGGVIDEKKEIYLSRTEEQEVRPVSGISSSSINSSSSDQACFHLASHKHAPKLKERTPQDVLADTDQEAKSTAESSSSSKPSGPSGLKHTALPLDPGSQNKERGSRPAGNYLSTNASATPARPAGLGRAAPLLEPTHHIQHPRVNGSVSAAQNQLVGESSNGETEEYDETREKLQMIRVKFLRLAHRLGQTPHNVVVAQVLYRLGLAEQLHGRSGGRVAAFSFDRASAMAEQLEAAGQEPLDFTCTVMVLGKSGVGKSATINSIFDEVMFGTDAFQLGTKKVQDIVGTVQGIRVRVIDTPGLLPSWSDQHQNEKILHSVKRFIKKTPPDIVLYLDRLDMQSRDLGDLPLLRTITEIFGPSIWFNAIVVLTHAASAPPEGPNGTATSYDMFVNQRSQVVQQAIRQAAGDMRLMNPVSLVENHSACRTNRAGQRVLPNGQVWKPHLLLLSFASKILAEANTLLKLQDAPPGRPFPTRMRSPPLPFLLSSLLQSRPEVKLPSEQFGDDDDTMDDDLDDCSDSEEESEYDELPPFKPLTKTQLEKLSKEQRKGYYNELDYRERLFMKKQLQEEKRRRKMLKKMQETVKELPAEYGDNAEEDAGAGAATVPVPMPDLVLPASFDSDNPTHRYRSLDSSNPWLVRAVLEPNGWDHDIGYDGINVERLFVVKEKVPISFSGHISKDKKDANLQMEVASSVKHGKGKATSLGFDMQSVGKDNAYTLRCETRFSNHRINKAAVGFCATVLGDVLTGGMKVEDKLIIGKRGQIVVSGGAIYGRGEAAYGGSLEATLKDKDHPLGRFLSTLGLSVMDWHGDLAIGCNSQTQIPIGRHTNLIGRFNINNRGSGQFSVRINSSEQLQIAVVGLIPLAKKLVAILKRRDMDNDRSG